MQKDIIISSIKKDFILKIKKGEISFLNSSGLLGWKSLTFTIIAGGKTEKFPEIYIVKKTENKKGVVEIQLTANYSISRVTEKMSIQYNPQKRFICIKREFYNKTSKPIFLNAVTDGDCKFYFPVTVLVM